MNSQAINLATLLAGLAVAGFMLYFAVISVQEHEPRAARRALAVAVALLVLYGAAGAIAASANVAPDLGAAVYDRYLQGDLAGALDYQTRLAPLRLAFGIGTHPAMLKAGAELMGVPVGPPRLPVQRLRPDENERLRGVLTGMGKL